MRDADNAMVLGGAHHPHFLTELPRQGKCADCHAGVTTDLFACTCAVDPPGTMPQPHITSCHGHSLEEFDFNATIDFKRCCWRYGARVGEEVWARRRIYSRSGVGSVKIEEIAEHTIVPVKEVVYQAIDLEG